MTPNQVKEHWAAEGEEVTASHSASLESRMRSMDQAIKEYLNAKFS